MLFQLKAEGHKRVEAFLFEKIFHQIITACPGIDGFTSGWLFQENKRTDSFDWFRLVTPTGPWNSLDDSIVEFLMGVKCSVIRVDYDHSEKEFKAIQMGNDNTGRLEDILFRLLNKRGPEKAPKNYSQIDHKQQTLALDFIGELFADSDLESLSLSRILINCYLFPWYGRQPMDTDAAVATEKDWSFVEFKRKYPAVDGSFGIDMEPHGILADWLEEHERSLLHVILVDPLWNKNESPVHLLTPDSVTAQHAVWLGVELKKGSYGSGQYTTTGADSGMSGGTRTQRKLSGNALKMLGTGMRPDRICSFLLNPDSIPSSDPLTHLKQERDMARAAHHSGKPVKDN